jgi:hypothetical protein
MLILAGSVAGSSGVFGENNITYSSTISSNPLCSCTEHSLSKAVEKLVLIVSPSTGSIIGDRIKAEGLVEDNIEDEDEDEDIVMPSDDGYNDDDDDDDIALADALTKMFWTIRQVSIHQNYRYPPELT